MNANELVSLLLETPVEEATVHRPPRSKVWVAAYTGATPGKQVQRSTGLAHRLHALAVAKEWEAQAREQRATLGQLLKKPTLRASAEAGQLSQKQVAQALGMSERGVREVERRAFEKLRRHPLLQHIWQQYQHGDLDEGQELELAGVPASTSETQSE